MTASMNKSNQVSADMQIYDATGFVRLPPLGPPAPIFFRRACAFSAASRLANGPQRTRILAPSGVSTFSVKVGKPSSFTLLAVILTFAGSL